MEVEINNLDPIKRFSIPGLLLIFAVCSSSCGNQPATFPAVDSNSQSSTTSDTEDSGSDTTPETVTDDSATGSVDSVDTADSDSVDTADSDSVDTADSGSVDTVDSGSVDTADSDSVDTADSGSVDTADTVDSDSDSVDTDSGQLSLCEVAALRDPGLVCCSGVSTDGFCEDGPQSCCTADLNGAMSCAPGEPWHLDWCFRRCGRETDTQSCVSDSCKNASIVDMSTLIRWSKQGSWSDYSNTFEPTGDSCGDGSGGTDIWFAVLVPAGKTVTFSETSSTNATVRLVDNCTAKTCTQSKESPEELSLTAMEDAATFFNVVLSKASLFTTPDWSVEVSMNP